MLRNQTESETATEPEPVISGRGHIDFYGYHTAAHGWFFCGWLTPEHPAIDGRVNIIAYFEQGQIAGAAVMSTLPRPDLGGAGVGVVIYLRGSGRPMGGLISLSLAAESATWTAFPPDTALILRDDHLLTQLRPILGGLRPNASKGTLVGLAARRGFTGTNTLGELSDRVFVEIDQTIFCPPDGVILIGWMLSHPAPCGRSACIPGTTRSRCSRRSSCASRALTCWKRSARSTASRNCNAGTWHSSATPMRATTTPTSRWKRYAARSVTATFRNRSLRASRRSASCSTASTSAMATWCACSTTSSAPPSRASTASGCANGPRSR